MAFLSIDIGGPMCLHIELFHWRILKPILRFCQIQKNKKLNEQSFFEKNWIPCETDKFVTRWENFKIRKMELFALWKMLQ